LNLLLKELGENSTFTVADAVGALKAKETTVRWVLWNLCDKGKIVRIGKGLYTFRSKVQQKSLPHLSTIAKGVKKIFEELGLTNEARIELFLWDLEIFCQLYKRLGDRLVLKGGAAAVDIDMICRATEEEIKACLEDIENAFMGEGDLLKFRPHRPDASFFPFNSFKNPVYFFFEFYDQVLNISLGFFVF